MLRYIRLNSCVPLKSVDTNSCQEVGQAVFFDSVAIHSHVAHMETHTRDPTSLTIQTDVAINSHVGHMQTHTRDPTRLTIHTDVAQCLPLMTHPGSVDKRMRQMHAA